MNPTRPRDNTAITAWIAEARYEALRVLRRPAYFVPVLVLPIVFFLMFGVALAKQNGGAEATLQVFIGYGIFGVLAATVMGLASAVATEREFGLLQLKRALPVPPGAYLGAKAFTALAIAGTVNLLLAVLAATVGHVQLLLWQWAAIVGIHLLGGLPFAAIGLYIGSRVSAAAAPGIANAVYLPLSFLGGLWVPLQFLPPVLKTVAHALPSYHLLQLPLTVVGRGAGESAWLHVGYLAIVAIVFFVLARQRLTFDGTGRGRSPWRRLARAAAIAVIVGAVLQLSLHRSGKATMPTSGANGGEVDRSVTAGDSSR